MCQPHSPPHWATAGLSPHSPPASGAPATAAPSLPGLFPALPLLGVFAHTVPPCPAAGPLWAAPTYSPRLLPQNPFPGPRPWGALAASLSQRHCSYLPVRTGYSSFCLIRGIQVHLPPGRGGGVPGPCAAPGKAPAGEPRGSTCRERGPPGGTPSPTAPQGCIWGPAPRLGCEPLWRRCVFYSPHRGPPTPDPELGAGYC